MFLCSTLKTKEIREVYFNEIVGDLRVENKLATRGDR